jgi:hypothetical protein
MIDEKIDLREIKIDNGVRVRESEVGRERGGREGRRGRGK